MAKSQNQQEQSTTREDAAKLQAERKETMEESAFRASQVQSQQVTPSATPSKTNVAVSSSPGLSEAVREQWNVPQEETTKPKANLQDVKAIGQSLKSQGVATNEVLPENSKQQVENSFDSSQGTDSTMKATDRVRMEAKKAVQNNTESQSPSTEWER